jgi:MFS family permease
MAYATAYAVHTLEMSALRGWGVAFLAYVATKTGATQAVLSPAVLATTLGLLGTAASILGNEAAIRFGRRRLVQAAMIGSITLGATIGFIGTRSYEFAAILVLIYGTVIWVDSSSLTAGTAGTAEPSRRGATLAVHSMLGYAGGFLGPLMIGWTLDLSGGMSVIGWGLAFGLVALLMAGALAAFIHINPQEVAGDRKRS